MGAPEIRLTRLRLTARTIWSSTCVLSASCGRWVMAALRPAVSRNSARAGDISSTVCGSVRWAKYSSERRRAARPAFAGALAPPRTTNGSPGPTSICRTPGPGPPSRREGGAPAAPAAATSKAGSAMAATAAAIGSRRESMAPTLGHGGEGAVSES